MKREKREIMAATAVLRVSTLICTLHVGYPGVGGSMTLVGDQGDEANWCKEERRKQKEDSGRRDVSTRESRTITHVSIACPLLVPPPPLTLK